jgi:acylphosphatase
MTGTACKRYLVSGRVQGVFFRASTAAQGKRLGLRGWAHNLADGRVEVVACGAVKDLDAMAMWLQDGPKLANVSRVDASAEDLEPYDNLIKPPDAVFF